MRLAKLRAAALCAASLAVAGCFTFDGRHESRTLWSGAVVSEHPLATRVGLRILERGGNAADAAVATALALAVVYPQAGNLGGGGFALYVPARGEPACVDFRETAPPGLCAELYLDERGRFVPERAVSGALAIGIPGSPRGLHEIHQRWGSGTLSWAEIVEPAVRLAREGFEVDATLSRDLESATARARMNEAARAVFYPGGRPLREGELLVQPELAATLAAYAARGPNAIYRGRIGSAIVREIQRTPVPGAGLAPEGTIALEDLRRYETSWPEPLFGRFRGYELFTMPPPSSGGLALLQVLGILEGLPLESERCDPAAAGEGALTERMAHWWIEALRLAFADRAEHLGDPAFHPVPVAELLSPEWIAARRVSIGERANLGVGPWEPALAREGPQTTHLSVVDRRANALSLTTTLNASFGSGILVEGAGFLLNNEMDDFAIVSGAPNMFGLVGSAANALAPGKRPLSSMSPTVVRSAEGELRLVLGSPGGPRIISSVLQVLLRVLVLEESLEEAVRAPRLHQQWRPEASSFEDVEGFRFDLRIHSALEARGHPIVREERTFGSVQAILVHPSGEVEHASDPRRGGAGGLATDRPARP